MNSWIRRFSRRPRRQSAAFLRCWHFLAEANELGDVPLDVEAGRAGVPDNTTEGGLRASYKEKLIDSAYQLQRHAGVGLIRHARERSGEGTVCDSSRPTTFSERTGWAVRMPLSYGTAASSASRKQVRPAMDCRAG